MPIRRLQLNASIPANCRTTGGVFLVDDVAKSGEWAFYTVVS
jgi:hypothetical protein